jgi:hypothetical protein
MRKASHEPARATPGNKPEAKRGQTSPSELFRRIKMSSRSARAFRADGGQVSLVGSHGLVCS